MATTARRLSGIGLVRGQEGTASSASSAPVAPVAPPPDFLEPHYRVQDLADLWRVGRTTVRLLVMNEPGVLRIGGGLLGKKVTYSVPESVARRIHTRLKSGKIG